MTQQFVRLIGGPNNGAIEKVDADQTQIVKTKPLPATSAQAFNSSRRSLRAFGLEPDSVTFERAIYTRRVLHCNDHKLFYFAPEGVSDLEVLQSVLGP